MNIEQIIALGESLEEPYEIKNIRFITPSICGVYIDSEDELLFIRLENLHFYGVNKTYIERQDVIDRGSFWFKDEKIYIENIKNIEFKEMILG